MNEIKGVKSQSGKIYDSFPDLESRERLEKIEYQPVTTDLAYSHKDLSEGEKTVTVSGDGVFGDKVYMFESVDLIPRKALKVSLPNGVTNGGAKITRNDYTYHIEGTSTCKQSIYFAESASDINIEVDESLIGKTIRAVSFVNEIKAGALGLVIKFYDSNGTALSTTNHNNQTVNQLSIYVGHSALTHTGTAVVPENTAYMRINMDIKAANLEFNHDIQLYLAVDENSQTGTLTDNSIEFTGTSANDIITAPYESNVNVNAPIGEYIKYMTKNAKGDTATYLTPEAFGAMGDGYADDSNAITACLAMANITKQTVLMAKKYLVSAPIDINGNGFNIIINDIVYNGTDTAVKIHGQQNTVKIHSVTSSGVGIKFVGDGTNYASYTLYNDLEINTISANSHGIIFESLTVPIYQNTVRFNLIKAGGNGCYGIAYFVGDGTYITENSFYGGHIEKCDWACYSIGGNSKFYGIQIEGNVKGGFYIVNHVFILNPRYEESARDGEYAFIKFVGDKARRTKIVSCYPLAISEIDLSENSDVFSNAAGDEFPLTENGISILDLPIYGKHPAVGADVNTPTRYTNQAIVWGKFLIFTPYMAYRKAVTTETLDTRLIGQETTDAEIRALSQLPTKFVVDTVNTEIYLHESYCAFGFNEFEVEQANGFTCKVYDKLNNLIFDGTEQGDGLYKFNVYKDSTYCANSSSGLLRRDFLGHYWSVTKINAYNPMPELILTASDSNTLQPNTIYDFGEVDTLTLDFAEGDSNSRNEYLFSFISGETATVLTLPSAVQWVNELTVEANKRYEISIVDNIALWCAVDYGVSE